MNNKHLACVLLGVVIALLGYLTLTIQGKATDMQQQADTAKSNAAAAAESRSIHQKKLTAREKETASIREFLKRWKPSFDMITNVDQGTQEIDKQVKEGDLTSLSGSVSQQRDKGRKGGYLESKPPRTFSPSRTNTPNASIGWAESRVICPQVASGIARSRKARGLMILKWK